MSQIQQIIEEETGEVLSSRKLKPNSNFVQFYRNEMQGLRELIATDPKAANLFMLITEKMDTENALVVSQETLAKVLKVSKRTVIRQITLLKDKGFLQIMKSGTANIYLVNANIAWTSSGDKKQYAKFRANVFVSKDEQEYNLKSKSQKQLDLIPKD